MISIYLRRILVIFSLLVSPIIIILSFILSGNFILSYYDLTLRQYINLSLEGYISFYLSILAIEVSAILAIVIYRWQYNDEKRNALEETRHAKHILKVLLINGTKRAFEVYNNQDEDDFSDFNFIRVTDGQIGLIATIGDLLTEEYFLYLNLLMETLKDMADNERNDALYEAKEALDKYMKLITLPFYSFYHLQMDHMDNMYNVIDGNAINLFNILANTDSKIDSNYRSIYNSEGKILFEIVRNGHFKIYNFSGDLLCNANVDGQGVIEGYAKIFNRGRTLEFEGNLKDRQRNGKGTEYYTLWNSGEIKKTGIWEDDELMKGTIYNVILTNKNELYTIDNELYNQLYSDSFSLHDVAHYFPEANIATLNVDNGNIEIDKKSIIPLAIIAKKEGYHVNTD